MGKKIRNKYAFTYSIEDEHWFDCVKGDILAVVVESSTPYHARIKFEREMCGSEMPKYKLLCIAEVILEIKMK